MKHIKPRSELVLMVAIILFLAVPLPFTLLSHIKGLKKSLRMGHLNGVLVEQTSTPFSLSSVVRAKYQESVSGFFDNTFFGRAPLIHIANEIYFRLFRISPMKSASILVGKNDALYEKTYLNEYCLQRVRASDLEPVVRNLKILQDACRRLGIGFVVLITPSKAAIYPEFIPNGWMRHYDPRPRAYAEIVPLLKEHGVHFVDGHALTATAKSSAQVPIFPKGGIHWGAYGAWITANALIAELQTQGKMLHLLEYRDMHISDNPEGEDADILALMNLEFPWHYPVADFTLKATGTNGPRPNLVIVGGSFTAKLSGLLSESRQFSEIDCFGYYKLSKKSFVDGKSRITAEPVQSVSFGREIFAADNLVLEINESVIPQMPNHLSVFLNDALKNVPEGNKPRDSFLYENPQPAP